jgi:ABC-type lipoprotein release transport system permease subunit
MIFRIAFKNVWRNKVRSLIVITAITLGLTGGLIVVAVMTGLVDQKVRATINTEVSHIQIHDSSFLKNYEPRFVIPHATSVIQSIEKIPGVRAVCGRAHLTGMAASSNSATGVQILGVDPAREKTVTNLYASIPDSSGGWFTGSRKNQVVIGHKLAEKLKVRLKSKIVLRFQGTDGNLNEAAFSITGIFGTSNTAFDETSVFVKKSDLDAITGGESGIHEIAVKLKDIGSIPLIQSRLKSSLPGDDVQNWIEIKPEMGVLTSAIAVEVYVILGIILFALAFGIVNTMLMIVFERTRELGMLMAVGMSKVRVFGMIMLETVFLTLIGGIIGMAVGAVVIGYLNRHGIDLSAVSKGLQAYGVDTKIYPFITHTYYINLTIMILSTGILSAIMPARKALKLNPVEAIRIA